VLRGGNVVPERERERARELTEDRRRKLSVDGFGDCRRFVASAGAEDQARKKCAIGFIGSMARTSGSATAACTSRC
jgi:hypothetical protein